MIDFLQKKNMQIWKNLTYVCIFRKKHLALIVLLEENKLQLINDDSIRWYKKNTKGNDIILGYYGYCRLKKALIMTHLCYLKIAMNLKIL